jgi:hypothetical protein
MLCLLGAGVLRLFWMNGIDERDFEGGRVVLLDEDLVVDANNRLGSVTY